MKKPLSVLFLILFMSLMIGLVAGQGLTGPNQAQSFPPIRLKAGTFTPSQGETLDIPANLKTAVPTRENAVAYYIVQFQGPVMQTWKDSLTELGVSLRGYIPDYAFKVRMTAAQATAVAALDHVIWVGLFEPAYRLSPDLIREGTQLYRIRLEAGSPTADIADSISQGGATLFRRSDDFLVVLAHATQLEAIAHITDVAWVENFTFHETHNEYGGGVIMGANTAHTNGYDGSTQIAAVADTGLGGGTGGTAHPDIPSGRITAIQNFTAADEPLCYDVIADGAQDVDTGHGTHTSLSVVSDGNASGEGTGTAPAANLVFQAVEEYVDLILFCEGIIPDGYYLFGIPDDLTDLFQPAYNAGARIHSNSWGSSVDGEYTADSVTTDRFIWNNPDMLITFSAGNAGTDGNGNGVVDNDSIGAPGTAKNVLTVGASENDRQGNWDCDSGLTYTNSDGDSCNSLGGQNVVFTYGEGWPGDFPANPLFSDPSAGNAEQMAAFSSRGPTDDGRIKPDVVAPGTWVLSGYSDRYQEGYDGSTNPQNGLFQYDGWGFPLDDEYKYMGGTSMSNPLAAGAAVVVRDFYTKTHSHNASAALVKATLINTAVDLLDENNDGANDNDFPIPNNHEGWGRVNMAAATEGSYEFVDNYSAVTGPTVLFWFDVGTGGSPFKVTLVWSDYPSTESASTNLVNNLNLVVRGPDGSPVYNGNVFSGGWSITGGSADSVNNVENVYVQTAAAGIWTIEVTGANVPQGPQPFALVVDGDDVSRVIVPPWLDQHVYLPTILK
jgi:serine protease AprX